MIIWTCIVKIFTHFRTHPSDLISSLALLATFWQGYLSRQHNRLSVRPRIDSRTVDDMPESTLLIFQGLFRNSGLGPAIINKYELIYNDVRHEVFNPEDVLELLKREFDGYIVYEKSMFYIYRPGSVISSGEEAVVVSLGLHINNEADVVRHQLSSKKYHIYLEYESAYGQKFSYDSRQHTKLK